jgi:hypothetical protein
VALEELSRFESDTTLEGALPQGGEVHPPPSTETPTLTVGAGPSTRAQEVIKEAMLESPFSHRWGPQRETGSERKIRW